MARISALGAHLLADPTDTVAAERHATARALYDQAATPAALRAVAAVAAEGLPRPAPVVTRTKARRRNRRALPTGIRAAAMQRRASPDSRQPSARLRWRVPVIAVVATGVVFAAVNSNVAPEPAAVRITGILFAAALLWLVIFSVARLHARRVAARTRRAALDARLNRIADEILRHDGVPRARNDMCCCCTSMRTCPSLTSNRR